MTPTLLKHLARLHPVIITLWGNDDNDTEPELLTRELRRVITVIFEYDDWLEGKWRRRLWVSR